MHLRQIPHLFRIDFIRHTFTLVSGAVIAQSIGLLVYPVLTRLYSPADFGVQSVFLSLALILSILATGRYEMAIQLPKDDRYANYLLQLSLTISLALCGICLVPSLFCSGWISRTLGAPELTEWLPLLPVYVLFFACCQVLIFYSNRFKEYKTIAAYNITQSSVSSGFRAGFGFTHLGGVGLILGSFLGYVGGLLAFLLPLHKRIRISLTPNTWRQVRKRAIEYKNFPKFRMVHLFINYFSGNLPVFVLTGWFSTTVSGIYALSYTAVFRPVNLFLDSVERTFSQRLIDKKNQHELLMPDLQRFIKNMAILALLSFIPAFLIAPVAFTWIFGREWAASATYFRVILPWMFMFFLSTPLSFIPDIFGKQQRAMWIEAVQFVLRVGALATGVLCHNPLTGMMAFSAVGVGIYGYYLLWYLSIVRKHDRDLLQTKEKVLR